MGADDGQPGGVVRDMRGNRPYPPFTLSLSKALSSVLEVKGFDQFSPNGFLDPT